MNIQTNLFRSQINQVKKSINCFYDDLYEEVKSDRFKPIYDDNGQEDIPDSVHTSVFREVKEKMLDDNYLEVKETIIDDLSSEYEEFEYLLQDNFLKKIIKNEIN